MPPSDKDIVVLSKKTKPTDPWPTVSTMSPLKTGSPWERSTVVPSNRVALATPLTVDTSPIDNTPVSAAWAYWPGARGPANTSIKLPFSNKPFFV